MKTVWVIKMRNGTYAYGSDSTKKEAEHSLRYLASCSTLEEMQKYQPHVTRIAQQTHDNYMYGGLRNEEGN